MLAHIISQFNIPGSLIKAERFGSGLINDTYLCVFGDAGGMRHTILQRINTAVFTRPEQVMSNVEIVTAHLAARLRREGVVDPASVMPGLVATRSGRSFLRAEDGSCWRMFNFIAAGAVYEAVVDEKHAYEIGRCLGRFQALVSDILPDALFDTLPGFHYTPVYLEAYEAVLSRDSEGRAREVRAELDFISSRRKLASRLTDLIASKELPLRIVHHDPKVNNIMIDHASGKALCMLDLDTVKAGIVHFDFGDCVRSAANPAGEDAQDPASARLDMRYFRSIASGYLREAGSFLTQKERAVLALSVQVITFELGLRFLTDYLQGDRYFKIQRRGHNLHRARVQFKLLESIEAEAEDMARFINGFPASG